MALQRTRFRGAWMNSANANVHLEKGALTFDDFRVTRDEGAGTGSFTYDFVKREVRLKEVKSTLRPTEAILWVEPKLLKDVAPYKFRQPPSIVANGVVHFGAPNDHLELTVDAPAGMDYVFLGKTLPIDRVSGRLLFTDNRLQLDQIDGTLFTGTVRGSADISLAKGDPHYQADIVVDGVDFPRVADLYFKHETARGRLSGTYAWNGLGSDARSMRGEGSVKVTEGDIFAIPIFGPLSGLLNAIIPGAGYSVAHKANATFTRQGRRDPHRRFQSLRQTFWHGRTRRSPVSRGPVGFRHPDRRRRTRGVADANVQAFRIQRRRQHLEADLAPEEFLISDWLISDCEERRTTSRSQGFRRQNNQQSKIINRQFSSAPTCRSAAASIARSSGLVRSNARRCRFL